MAIAIETMEVAISRSRDEYLLEQYRNGHSDALEALVRDYIPKTYRKVCILIPESDVQDVMQEIFLSLIESINNFKSRTNFSAWFNKITMRRIADYYRWRSRQRDKVSEDQFCEVDDIQNDAAWKNIDDRLTVEEALVGMPENYTEILALKFLEDLSLAEISDQLHLTYEATRSRYRRAMGVLKRRFNEAI